MNATTGAVERQILNAPAAIDGIAVADVAPALGPELLYCAGGRLYVVNLRRLGTSHYMSPFVTAGLGAHDGIVVTDVDQDGSKEILLNCEYLGVRLLETKTLLSHLK